MSDFRWRTWQRVTRGVRYDFLALVQQPRRILTSPCWSGIDEQGQGVFGLRAECRAADSLADSDWTPAFLSGSRGLSRVRRGLPTFKPRISLEASGNLLRSSAANRSLTLACITPHGKWHIHTTYYDDLRMLTLSRGVEPFWLNDQDAAEMGILDNDWVEAYNDNGVVVTRAVVSARIPRGHLHLLPRSRAHHRFPQISRTRQQARRRN